MTLGLPDPTAHPRALHLSIVHAENLCEVLSRLADPSARRTIARAWLLGRRQEVECFIENVTKDSRSGRLSEASASRAIDAYLTALHKGLADHFGERFPSCCAACSSPAGAIRRHGHRKDPDGTPPFPLRSARRARKAQEQGVAAESLLAGLTIRARG